MSGPLNPGPPARHPTVAARPSASAPSRAGCRAIDGRRLGPVQLTSPYFVLGRRRSSTYNRVRLRPAPPSGLVWLVPWTGTCGYLLGYRRNWLETHQRCVGATARRGRASPAQPILGGGFAR